jgi:hypothetical protein
MFEQKIDLFNLFIIGKKRKINTSDIPDLIYSLLKFIYFDFQKLFKKNNSLSTPNFKGKKIVYVDTINNYESLKFLTKHYSVLFVTSARTPVKSDIIGINRFLDKSLNLEKYLFLLYLFINQKYGIKNYKSILLNYNRFEDYYALFKDNRPELFFISNDHEPKSRGLIQASEILEIPIFYFQHASISNLFPPLNFTASFLYGSHSKLIYESKPLSRGEVYLVGNHKFDPFKEEIMQKEHTNQIKKIGIAYNELDDIEKVSTLIKFLVRECPLDEIVVRPHPRDNRLINNNNFEFSQTVNIKFSNSVIENSIEFLLDIDLLVAGNSSILLEAALTNVLPIYFSFGKYASHLNDYYGFVSTGIAHYARDYNELKSFIIYENFPGFIPRKKAAIYDASVGSDFEFSVEERIISILKERHKIV